MTTICPRCSLQSMYRVSSRHDIFTTAQRTKRREIVQWQRAFSVVNPHQLQYVRYRYPSRRSPILGSKQLERETTTRGSANLPDEIPLLPQTFVYPRAASQRWNWTLRKAWARSVVGEISAAIAAWFAVRPRPYFKLRQTKEAAVNLHEKMYQALASGNLEGLQRSMCPGLLRSLAKRVRERGKGNVMKWSMKRTARPKLCSYKIVMLPGHDKVAKDKKSGIYQAVVKLESEQTLQRFEEEETRDKQTDMSKIKSKAIGEPITKKLCEYVVIQRPQSNGTLGPWKLWGFAKETDLQEWHAEGRRVLQQARQQSELTANR